MGILDDESQSDFAFTDQAESQFKSAADTGLGAILREPGSLQVDEEDDGSTFGAFGAGYATSGIIAGATQIEFGEDTTDDPDYSHPKYFATNEDDWSYVEPYFNDIKDPLSKGLLEAMKGVRNNSMMASVIERHRTSVMRMKEIAESPWLGGLGMFASIGTDILATMGTSLAVNAAKGGMTLAAYMKILNQGSLVARATAPSMGAMRTMGAAKVGAFGALEGGSERLIHSLYDPMVTGDDILNNAIIGALFGGALGGAFPRSIGGIRKQYRSEMGAKLESSLDELASIKNARKGSVGAARKEDNPDLHKESFPGDDNFRSPEQRLIDEADKAEEAVQRQAKGGGTPLAQWFPDWIRNPKRIIQGEYGAKARRDRANGLEGRGTFFDSMTRLYHMTPVMEGERLGEKARARSYQTWFNSMEDSIAGRNAQIDVEYANMAEEIFEVSKGLADLVKRARVASEVLPKSQKIDRIISKAEYEQIADELAQANATNRFIDAKTKEGGLNPGERVDIGNVIPPSIRKNLSDEEAEKIIEFAQITAAKDDDWWKSFQQDLVDQKLLEPEDIIDGYRPQIWNREEILTNVPKFKNWLLRVLDQEPDRTWVNDGWRKADDPEGDGWDPVEEFWKAEESWQDFAIRLPDEAAEMLEDWGLSIRRKAENLAGEALDRSEKELSKLQGDAVDDILVKYARDNERDVSIINRSREALENGIDDPVRKDTMINRLMKAEERQKTRKDRLVHLDNARGNLEELQTLINKWAPNKVRAKGKKKLNTVRNRIRAENKVAGSKLIGDKIDNIINKITGGDGDVGRLSDLSDEKFTSGQSRLLNRQIHLGAQRHTDEARKFLNTNASELRRNYNQQVGSRLAMRKGFAPVMRRNQQEFAAGASDRGTYERMALMDFDKDIAKLEKAGDTKGAAKMRKTLSHAKRTIEKAFDQIERKEIPMGDGAAVTGAALQTTAIASLGSMIIQNLGDLGLFVTGGSRFATGFQSIMRPGRVSDTFKEILKDEPRMAALLMGQNVIENTRWQGMSGVDLELMATEGTRLRKYQLYAKEIGHVQAMATGSMFWNQWIRGAFGHDFILQIRRDFDDYDAIPGLRKTFYARHGIDRESALEMKDMMAKHGKNYGPKGELRVPDTEAWARLRPDLLSRWEMAVKGASDEVLLDPQAGDLPYLRSSRFGRLIIQFTSFTFTASERVIPRITQQMVTHPEDAGIYVMAGMGLGMGFMVDALKTMYHGKDIDTHLEKPIPDLVWGAVIRSPLAVSMMGTLVDNAFTYAGGPVNEAVGFNFLPQASSKFKRQQGLFSLGGPAMGIALGTLPDAGRRALDGDVDEALGRLGRLAPLYNTALLQTFIKGLESAAGD